MIDKIYFDVFTHFGTDKVSHSKRKLLDHLIETHNLLESWKSPRQTCLTGLFHRIYGTAHFMDQTVSIASRITIQDLIGQEAEILVYLFCVTDRQEFYANIGCSTFTLHDIRNQTQWSGSPDILNQLLTMDLANWVEMVPYIGHELSDVQISRTIEMFETAGDFFPAMAIDSLIQIKEKQVGQEPEIYISGAGVARGYLNLPGMTAESFIPDPRAQEPGSRMYCTGDYGCYDAHRNIIFQGRKDSQVKIRGHRVEIHEIESILYRHPLIAHGLSVKNMSIAGDTSLLAFVLLHPGREMTKKEVFEYLQEILPFYMIPEDVKFLDHLPLTVTGKNDRLALLELDHNRPTLSTRPADHLSLWEGRIADIWKEVLRMEVLDTQDNCFQVGGIACTKSRSLQPIEESINSRIKNYL